GRLPSGRRPSHETESVGGRRGPPQNYLVADAEQVLDAVLQIREGGPVLDDGVLPGLAPRAGTVMGGHGNLCDQLVDHLQPALIPPFVQQLPDASWRSTPQPSPASTGGCRPGRATCRPGR